MKVVSLMAGVGITDMCFTQQGAQIIVASDINQSSMEVYKYNHQYADSSYNPICVIGDLTNGDIQNQIIAAAKAKLEPGEALDLLTLFVPPAKNLKEILAAVRTIAQQLNTKLIYMDALSYNRYYLAKISNIVESMDVKEYYYGFSANHHLNESGVPNTSKRQAVLFLNKTHLSDAVFYLTKHRANYMPPINAPVIKELFTPISLLKEQTPLPLHQPTALLKQGVYDELFYQELAQLNPNESLFKKNGNAHSLTRYKNKLRGIKIDENQIFPFTLSERAKLDWEWAIHPKEPRGFTPLELCFLATLNLIPFELAPESAITPIMASTIIQRITNATAPAYLFRFLQEVLFPIVKHEKMQPLELKHPERYHRAQIEKNTYYLGSYYSFKSRITNNHSLLFSEVALLDKENANYLFEHREKLMNQLKRAVNQLKEKSFYLNAYSEAIIDFIQSMSKPFKVVRCNDIHYQNCIQKETKLYKMLTSILAKSIEVPFGQAERLKNYFLNEFVIPMRRAKAQSLPSIALEAYDMIDLFTLELNTKYKSFTFSRVLEYEVAQILTELSSTHPPAIPVPDSQQTYISQANNEVMKQNVSESTYSFFKPQTQYFDNENLNVMLTKSETQNTTKKRKTCDSHPEKNDLKHAKLSIDHFFNKSFQPIRGAEENLSPDLIEETEIASGKI